MVRHRVPNDYRKARRYAHASAALCLHPAPSRGVLVSKISYKLIVFRTRSGSSAGQHSDQPTHGIWRVLRATALLTLALSVVIAVVLTAFVIAWILSTPLIVTALYSLARAWWRGSLRGRGLIP
jgi:hypothetical protein